jgi:hypothetical protein
MQKRDEKALREDVLIAERLLLIETGFNMSSYHLHGDVSELCSRVGWHDTRVQLAWNIVNDRCPSRLLSACHS